MDSKERDMKIRQSQQRMGTDMDLATAFIKDTERILRPARILFWLMVAVTFIYFLYILYTGKSLLNMLPLVIPLMAFLAQILFSNFP